MLEFRIGAALVLTLLISTVAEVTGYVGAWVECRAESLSPCGGVGVALGCKRAKMVQLIAMWTGEVGWPRNVGWV